MQTMPTTGYTFRTKTGLCTITPEQIVLTRTGLRGATAAAVYGSSIGRSLVLYSVVGGGALLWGFWLLARGSLSGAFLVLIGLFLLWNVFASRSNSAAAAIARAAIQTVEAHPPRPPLTRGYFTVHFLEDGKARQRLIMLPGSMSNGQEEYKQAVAAMHAAGLLPTPNG